MKCGKRADAHISPYAPFTDRDRLTGTVVPANRGTSSKPACFIRHWRRFADFPSHG
ncbi:MAG: hypothetical protein KH544_04590 [Firmicutes bacterium]|nr:hypothetical protein [Bacillota bacterium]